MPLLIDTETRTGALVLAVNEVLAAHGADGLTLRRVAEVSGVSTSSILHHLGSRERLLRVVAHRTGRARLRDLDARRHQESALALLPNCADDVVVGRAWLAWLELWRTEDSLATVIHEARDEERAALARIMDFRLGPEELDATMALVDGLLVALCDPHRPMRRRLARDVLARHLDLDEQFRRVPEEPWRMSPW